MTVLNTGQPDWPADILRRNAEVNRALFDALRDDHLNLRSAGGGWSVGEHLRHLAQFRRGWVSELAPAFAPAPADVGDVPGLLRALDAGDAAALAAVQDAAAQGRSFVGAYGTHPGLMLLHIAIHDSHHRGQILATLREFGHLVDDNPIWHPWNELEGEL